MIIDQALFIYYHMLGGKDFLCKGNEGVTIDGSIENIGAVIKSALILAGYAAFSCLPASGILTGKHFKLMKPFIYLLAILNIVVFLPPGRRP